MAAVGRVTADLDADGWDSPACGLWSATETARHLLATAGWYHQWLDRALDGEQSRPFPGEDIDEHTAHALALHDDLAGPDAATAFAESARDYLVRARADWDLPYSFPFGTVTVGLHAGVAAAEWHLHAWDLSGLTGTLHAPAEPATLFVAAGSCVAAAAGGVKGAALAGLLPLAARRAPWEAMLRRSGRA